MTQFKDKAARQGAERFAVGLFTYPVLQAADILLYQAAQVPVGEDQRQHLELTRDLAQRFNQRYGDTFVVPEPLIVKETAKIVDLAEPTAKMSKSSESQAGVVDILEDPASIAKKIKRAVTDTGTEIRFDPAEKPGVSNLLTIASALSGKSISDLEAEFSGKGYGALKSDVADVVVEFTTPLRERTSAWLDDPAGLDAVLADGAEQARAVAAGTLAAAYDAVGFLPARS
jgi:tryptophanyl-tRNA synthetase